MEYLQEMGIGAPGGLPMPKITTAEEVREERALRVASIFENYAELCAIVRRHERVLQSRWIKKSKGKRKQMLCSAWGSKMAESHRPDIQAWRNLPNGSKTVPDRSPYLWPYMNQEDMSRTEPLLLMLNARGRHSPDEFAWADFENCRLGVVCFAIERKFLNEHIMLFRGRKTEDAYAKLMHWDDHPDAMEWMTEQRHPAPADGLVMLEVQDGIYKFLVRCCRLLLHDINPLTGPNVPLAPEPPLVSANTGRTTSLATASLEAFYRLPAHLDLAALEQITKSRLYEAQDHLWGLRQDPSYFAAELLNWREHRQELILDANSKAHHVARKPELLWQRIIFECVDDALSKVEIWATLHAKVCKMRDLMARYAGAMDPDKDLPKPIAMGFYTLQHMLETLQKKLIRDLKMRVPSSPPLRTHFLRLPEPNTRSTVIRVQSKTTAAQQTAAESEILWIMSSIWDDNQRHILGPKTLMDQLEMLMRRDPTAKSRISSLVAATVSMFSDMAEMLHQINLFQPWAATFETHALDNKQLVEGDFEALTRKLTQASAWGKMAGRIAVLGSPEGDAFWYPADRRPTRDNVEAMQRAEKRLDEFWDMVLGSATLQESQRAVIKREVVRTGKWIEDPASGEKQDEEDEEKQGEKRRLKKEAAIPFVCGEDEVKEHAVVAIVGKKEKIKTRGKARESLKNDVTREESENTATLSSIHPGDTSVTAVDARSAKVLRTLFFVPGQAGGAGRTEVPWVDFLHTMTSAGFSATKRYGSGWIFKPRPEALLDVQARTANNGAVAAAGGKAAAAESQNKAGTGTTAISIHEPHPGNKISFHAARNIGRRLRQQYGWSGEMFGLGQ